MLLATHDCTGWAYASGEAIPDSLQADRRSTDIPPPAGRGFWGLWECKREVAQAAV